MAVKFDNWGMKLLGAWLLLHALHDLFDLHFEGFGIITGVLALLAGILILIER